MVFFDDATVQKISNRRLEKEPGDGLAYKREDVSEPKLEAVFRLSVFAAADSPSIYSCRARRVDLSQSVALKDF